MGERGKEGAGLQLRMHRSATVRAPSNGESDARGVIAESGAQQTPHTQVLYPAISSVRMIEMSREVSGDHGRYGSRSVRAALM